MQSLESLKAALVTDANQAATMPKTVRMMDGAFK